MWVYVSYYLSNAFPAAALDTKETLINWYHLNCKSDRAMNVFSRKKIWRKLTKTSLRINILFNETNFFKKMKFQQNLQFIFDTFYLLTLSADKFSKEIFSHLTYLSWMEKSICTSDINRKPLLHYVAIIIMHNTLIKQQLLLIQTRVRNR